ncbi:uncharacterized protein LOC126840823 isoform X2 [Adelges cooleyi]|nr:uncharacterized protein LOC126840823 isoform X2 [Adelges cooleyi]
MAINNEIGNKCKNVITKLNAKTSILELVEPDESEYENMDIVEFRENLFSILKRHLIDCLRMDNTNKTYTLSKFVDLISIKQNLLNNSVALLLQHKLDIKPLMRLYLFFCGPIQAPNDSAKYGPRNAVGQFVISHVQNDMMNKFKDIIGDAPLPDGLSVIQSETLKENTRLELWGLATVAISKMEPNGGPLMRGTPLHFTCIDILKWTALMESDNEDAVRIQRVIITVEGTAITLRQYAERYRYEIDIDNLEGLNYEVLLRLNKVLLYYVYTHFGLSTILIYTRLSKLNLNSTDFVKPSHDGSVVGPSRPVKLQEKRNKNFVISFLIEQIGGLRAFLEIFNLFFIPRFLKYVYRPTVQSKLTALISYMDRFSDSPEDTALEMQQSPEKIVINIKHLVTDFALALLPVLKVDEPEKWIDYVNEIVAGKSADISSAMVENQENALSIMVVSLTQLNPDWPDFKNRNPIEFLRATKDS